MGFKGPEASNVVVVCDYRNVALLLFKKKSVKHYNVSFFVLN